MKTILLIFVLAIAVESMAQSAEEQLQKAKSFLNEDPCNNTGLSWVKGALQTDPNNQEAKDLIAACDEVQLERARELFAEDPTSYKGVKIAEKLVAKNPKDEELNYLLAKANMDIPNHIVEEYISIAIEANPTNPEYRWMRFRCNMLGSSDLADFQMACDDLNSMLENGAESAKVYANLSEAEYRLANEWKKKSITPNTGWQDDNSQQESEESEKTKHVVLHLENAKSAAHKAIDMDEGYKEDLTYTIESINDELAAIESEHNRVK